MRFFMLNILNTDTKRNFNFGDLEFQLREGIRENSPVVVAFSKMKPKSRLFGNGEFTLSKLPGLAP